MAAVEVMSLNVTRTPTRPWNLRSVTSVCVSPSRQTAVMLIAPIVVAAVTFGAVARSRDQNYTIGDGKSFDGTRARTTEQLSALNKYSDRLRDYCHHGDPICAVGSEPVDVAQHLDYFILHNEEVVKWVTEKAKSSSQEVSTSSSTVLAKSAAVPTPTPSIIASNTLAATDSSEAPVSAQTGETAATGAAGGLSVAYAPIVALTAAALLFAA